MKSANYSKLNIALVELHGHLEVLQAFCCALKHAKLTIFTNPELKAHDFFKVDAASTINIALREERESSMAFLARNKSKLDNFDWIIFVTIEKHFKYLAKQSWKAKTIVVVHNGNYWFDYYNNVRIDSFKNAFRWIRAVVLRTKYHRDAIIENMDYCTFPNPTIQHYFLDKKLIGKEKIFPCLPFVFKSAEQKSTFISNDTIIVIPGAIKIETRDYDTVIEALKNSVSLVKAPMKVVLLGKAKGDAGKNIQHKLASISCSKLAVLYFDEYINQQEYDTWLNKADFLILPLKRDMRFAECHEIGGLTKISGSLNDMERFSKPALVSKQYVVEDKHLPLVEQYSDSSALSEKITKWVNDKSILIQKKAMFIGQMEALPPVDYCQFFKMGT